MGLREVKSLINTELGPVECEGFCLPQGGGQGGEHHAMVLLTVPRNT